MVKELVFLQERATSVESSFFDKKSYLNKFSRHLRNPYKKL